MSATMTKPNSMTTEFERIREREAALLRVANRRALPGDGLLLEREGFSPGTRLYEDNLGRLKGVEHQTAKAGSAAAYRQAQNVLAEIAPRVEAAVGVIDSELATLERQVGKLRAERAKYEAELKTATATLEVMDAARERLRSLQTLPKEIAAEVSGQIAAIKVKTQDERRRLSDEISVAKSHGKTAKAEYLQSQLDALMAEIKEQVDTECAEVLDFYVGAIE